jgi:hypothetical protein
MRHFPCGFALLLLLFGCGGGTAAAGDAKSAGADDSRSRESAGSDGRVESDGDESAAAPEKAKGASCDDGTCSTCGNSICPSGWYCDEKASACSWLTECAEKPTCSCVTRVLGRACKCREEAGGLKVACE